MPNKSRPKPPFSKNVQLATASGTLTSVPGYPHINIQNGSGSKFIRREVDVTRLSALGEHLWIAGRKGHFRTLHKQLLLRRSLIITENPAMHLVWFENSIFLKPCPEALLYWDIWEQCICAGDGKEDVDDSDNEDGKSTAEMEEKENSFYLEACGFLNSYVRLIVHPSDYRIAVQHHLIPDVGFHRWCLLAAEVAATVSKPGFTAVPRWQYGELRLSRLNLIYKFTFRGYSYAYLYTTYGAYFNKNLGVLLLGFAYCSIILAAMQVVVALRDRTDWLAAWCLRFSVAIIFGVTMVAIATTLLSSAIFLTQLVRTLVHKRTMHMPTAAAAAA